MDGLVARMTISIYLYEFIFLLGTLLLFFLFLFLSFEYVRVDAVYLSLTHTGLFEGETLPLDVVDLKGRGITLERNVYSGSDAVGWWQVVSIALLTPFTTFPLLPLFFLNPLSKLRSLSP